MKSKVVGVIPARFQSSRFPGKPLAKIHGKEMILWVIEGAQKSKLLDKIMVATDDERIFFVGSKVWC
jgi:3-deoxy-manno-octulosonate cytidylyltransferase (CMP-KDO synthetase)